MGYKENFIRKFGELFTDSEVREHGEGNCVSGMEFVHDFHDESKYKMDSMYNGLDVVIIHWNGGGHRIINVTGDSCGAMVQDVMKHFW